MLILFLFSRENQTPHISYMIQILIEQHPPAGWCWQSYTSQVFKTLVLSSGFFFEMCFHFQTVKGFVSVPSSARGCDDDFLVSWAAQNGQKGRLFWHNNLKNKWPRKLYYASNWLSDHLAPYIKVVLSNYFLKRWYISGIGGPLIVRFLGTRKNRTNGNPYLEEFLWYKLVNF